MGSGDWTAFSSSLLELIFFSFYLRGLPSSDLEPCKPLMMILSQPVWQFNARTSRHCAAQALECWFLLKPHQQCLGVSRVLIQMFGDHMVPGLNQGWP